MSDWKEVIKHNDKYKNFVIVENPIHFTEMYAGRDIPRVQLYSTSVFSVDGKEQLIGFCGVFEWKSNEIISLDQDSYSNFLVLGYKECDNCLCVLVGQDW